MKPLGLYTHTSIYLENKKEVELKDSLFVVPQNRKCGTTFLRQKTGEKLKQKLKYIKQETKEMMKYGEMVFNQYARDG